MRPIDVVNDPILFEVWWKSREFEPEVWPNDALIVSAGVGLGLLWYGQGQSGLPRKTPEAEKRSKWLFDRRPLAFMQAMAAVDEAQAKREKKS